MAMAETNTPRTSYSVCVCVYVCWAVGFVYVLVPGCAQYDTIHRICTTSTNTTPRTKERERVTEHGERIGKRTTGKGGLGINGNVGGG